MAFSGSFSGAHAVAEKGKRWLKRAFQIMLCSLFSLVLLGCVNRAQSIRVVDLPDVPNRDEVRQLTNGRRGGLSEVAPPAIFLDLDDLDAIAHPSQQPQVAIAFPQSDAVLDDPSLNVKVKLRGLSIYRDEKTGLGPHLQVILDNQPAKSVYSLDDAIEFSDLTPGSHTLRVLAVKPWGESFKNETAYAQTSFHIFAPTGENSPDPSLPTLTYNEPQGTYGAQPILLDFHLNNAPLHQIAASDPTLTDWRIRCDLNGNSFIFDQWQPIYLNGFKPGRNWLQLTLIDEAGNPIENAFNSTIRIINFDPAQRDTLAQMTRGELPLSKVGQVVAPNYEPPAEIPAEPPAEDPSEVPAETQQPADETANTSDPDKNKPAANSPEESEISDEPVTIDDQPEQPTADKKSEKAKDTKTEAKAKEANQKKPTEDEGESSAAKPALEKETVKPKEGKQKEPEEVTTAKEQQPLAKEKSEQTPSSQPEAKPFSNEFRNFDDFDQDTDLDKDTKSEDKASNSRDSTSKNTSEIKGKRTKVEPEKPPIAPSRGNPIEPDKESEELNVDEQTSVEDKKSGEDKPSVDNPSIPETNTATSPEPPTPAAQTDQGVSPSLQDRLQTFLKQFKQSDTEKTAPVIPTAPDRIERSAPLEETGTSDEPKPQDTDLPSALTAPSTESKAELIKPKLTPPEPAKFGSGKADLTGDSATADTIQSGIDAEKASEDVLEEALEQAIEQASPAAEEFIDDAEQLVDGAQDAVSNFFSNRINRFKSSPQPTEINPIPTEEAIPIPTETATEKATEEALP